MNFYEDISKSLNLIAGASLVLGIENEVLHEAPHIEIPDYLVRNEGVMYVASGFAETVVFREIVLPSLSNPNFLNSFTVFEKINLDAPTAFQG